MPIQLILPYVDVDLKYYDLGMENRDAVSRSQTSIQVEAP